MKNRYIKNIPSISENEQEQLADKHVLCAGCDGVCQSAVEMLCRIGVGHITVFDNKIISEQDISSEPVAGCGTAGKPAVYLLDDRIKMITPETELNVWKSAVRESTAESAVSGKDIVIASMTDRELMLILERECARSRKVLIAVNAMQWSAHLVVCTPGSNAVSGYYANNRISDENSVMAFSVNMAASMLCAETVKYLLDKEPDPSDRILHMDLRKMNFMSVPVNEAIYKGSIRITVDKLGIVAEKEAPFGMTVAELFKAEGFNYDDGTIFVVKNRDSLAREEYDRVLLEDGDTITFRRALVAGG